MTLSKAAQERYKAQQAAKTLPEKENYSAKQAAMRLATDARTFRKFLRSSHCSFEAVGQGKRYEFTHEELMTLRDEFIEWREYCEARRTTDRNQPGQSVPISQVKPNPEVQFSTPPEEMTFSFEDQSFHEAEPTEEELLAIEEGVEDDD